MQGARAYTPPHFDIHFVQVLCGSARYDMSFDRIISSFGVCGVFQRKTTYLPPICSIRSHWHPQSWIGDDLWVQSDFSNYLSFEQLVDIWRRKEKFIRTPCQCD